jgi:hypothetical protein
MSKEDVFVQYMLPIYQMESVSAARLLYFGINKRKTVKTARKELTTITKRRFAKVVRYNFLYGMENIVWLALKILTLTKRHKNVFNVLKAIS